MSPGMAHRKARDTDTVFPQADIAFGRFRRALGKVMRVSKADLKQMLEVEEAANSGRSRPGPKRKRGAGAGP
jgi:hypothetical protein